MTYAPLHLIVYTRKKNLENLVNSLKTNPEASETDLWIVSDAAAKDSDKDAVTAVRDYIKSINGFKSVHIIAPDKNSRIYNINHNETVKDMLLNKYGKIIQLEDDNIVSKHFLKYMNEALEFYKDYKNIGAICGYQLPIKIPKNYKKDIYLGLRYSPWGVGFTKRWYEQINMDNIDRYSIAIKPENKKKFLKAGKSLLDILKEDSEKKIYAPDARICFHQIMNNIYSIFPCISLVKNVGFDGSGEHNGISYRWDTVLDNRKEYSIKMVKNIQPNEKVLKKIQKYQDFGYSLKHFIKKILKKIGLFYFVKKYIIRAISFFSIKNKSYY